MFSALACVIFASNEEIQKLVEIFDFESKAPCAVHLKVINPDREAQCYDEINDLNTEKAHGEFKVKYLVDLKEQKYIFDKKTDISVS